MSERLLKKALAFISEYTGTCPRDYDPSGFGFDCKNKCDNMDIDDCWKEYFNQQLKKEPK